MYMSDDSTVDSRRIPARKIFLPPSTHLPLESAGCGHHTSQSGQSVSKATHTFVAPNQVHCSNGHTHPKQTTNKAWNGDVLCAALSQVPRWQLVVHNREFNVTPIAILNAIGRIDQLMPCVANEVGRCLLLLRFVFALDMVKGKKNMMVWSKVLRQLDLDFIVPVRRLVVVVDSTDSLRDLLQTRALAVNARKGSSTDIAHRIRIHFNLDGNVAVLLKRDIPRVDVQIVVVGPVRSVNGARRKLAHFQRQECVPINPRLDLLQGGREGMRAVVLGGQLLSLDAQDAWNLFQLFDQEAFVWLVLKINETPAASPPVSSCRCQCPFRANHTFQLLQRPCKTCTVCAVHVPHQLLFSPLVRVLSINLQLHSRHEVSDTIAHRVFERHRRPRKGHAVLAQSSGEAVDHRRTSTAFL